MHQPARFLNMTLLLCMTLLGVHARTDASELRMTAIVRAVQAARPSVVNIHGRKSVSNLRAENQQVNGMGTGIVIDERGYIITNYHVVQGVSSIQVTLHDGKTLIGELISHDPSTDLAVIRIHAEKSLPVIKVGTSEDLMPGETVIAVGNAYGYNHTVTQGIISALHRSVQVSDEQKYDDLIQTDASINPGNSGGPLLNIDGDMIGINVAVRVGAQGIGFAIPIDEALVIAARLLSTERVNNVAHGIRVEPKSGKAVVVDVLNDTAAEAAGLKVGDVLASINGKTVFRALDVERALIDQRDGKEVDVQVSRDGQTKSLKLMMRKTTATNTLSDSQIWRRFGVRVRPVGKSVLQQQNSKYRGGLKITAVRPLSPAAQHGIRVNDVLVGMHKWETISVDNLLFVLKSQEVAQTGAAKFYLVRNGQTLYGSMSLSVR